MQREAYEGGQGGAQRDMILCNPNVIQCNPNVIQCNPM